MSKAFPTLVEERISAEGFLSIQSCVIEVRDITVLIGPQASGKSIIAKLIYYFRKFVSDLFYDFMPSLIDRTTINKRKYDEFYELFPGADSENNAYVIRYDFSEFYIELKKQVRNRKISISFSPDFLKLFEKTRAGYRKFLDSQDRERVPYYNASVFYYTRRDEDTKRFFDAIPRVLFVPASRAFFSTIKRNVFSFLSESKSLDPLMVQFGIFLENAKEEYTELPRSRRPRGSGPGALEEIISGRYHRVKDEDFIQTRWGSVALQNSSSGQQEALPLLLALSQYPKRQWPNDMIIIEEPEAHLFPLAQKRLLEAIVATITSRTCKIVLTTHSPYVLACINNEIHKMSKRNEERSLQVSSYYVSDGEASDIMDYDDSLIDMSELDKVSDIIASEFAEALDG